MASPQRRAQNPRVLFVPAGTAPPRLPWLTAPQPRARRTPLAKLTSQPAPSHKLLPGPLDQYRPIQLQLIQDGSFASISTAITTSATALPTEHNCATGCGRRN